MSFLIREKNRKRPKNKRSNSSSIYQHSIKFFIDKSVDIKYTKSIHVSNKEFAERSRIRMQVSGSSQSKELSSSLLIVLILKLYLDVDLCKMVSSSNKKGYHKWVSRSFTKNWSHELRNSYLFPNKVLAFINSAMEKKIKIGMHHN